MTKKVTKKGKKSPKPSIVGVNGVFKAAYADKIIDMFADNIFLADRKKKEACEKFNKELSEMILDEKDDGRN